MRMKRIRMHINKKKHFSLENENREKVGIVTNTAKGHGSHQGNA